MAPTVALLSPGAMGAVVGQVLRQHGATVITSLEGRSEASAARAREAGLEAVSDDDELVDRADLLLSILVPAEVVRVAERVAAAVKSTGSSLVFVDCNAVAPHTGRQVADIVAAAGATAVDAGIIGGPPRRPGTTRFYASGAQADRFAVLGDYGLDVRVLGPEIGQASAFKMCYAAQTKGRYAIFLESLVTAARLGLYDELIAELQLSQMATYEDTARSLPGIPSKAGRWIGEMEEIAATFGGIGLPPQMFAGAAEVYRYVSEATAGDSADDGEAEDRLRQVVEALARALP
jgi:3-hydroxyisobutyrate dehydrogenase-like beta-hydroxyacid dehydrogenase